MDRFLPVGGLGPKVGEGDGNTYIVTEASLRAEIARLTAERDHWKRIARHTGACMTCRGPNGAPEPYGCSDCLNTGWSGEYHNGLADAENELNQALARAAAVAMEMRERAADLLQTDGELAELIRALPIDPDAQKALDEMLARAREDAIREAAAEAGRPDEDDDRLDRQCRIIVREQILDLLTDGGRDE